MRAHPAAGAVQAAIGSHRGSQWLAAKGVAPATAMTDGHRSPKLPDVPMLAQAGGWPIGSRRVASSRVARRPGGAVARARG